MKTERHGYRFTNKYNTRGGIISTVIAFVSVILLICGIMIAYKKDGNAGMIVGIFGTLSFGLSTAGIIFGLKSFTERDGFYLFSWIGSISNAMIWIAMCAIIVMGMMGI